MNHLAVIDSESHADEEIVALLTQHQLDIKHYVQSLMPGDSSAQDVAQQANITLWRKRADFELGTNFKAWSFAIARYEVLNHRKRQIRDNQRLVFSEELIDIFAEELPELDDGMDEKQEALRTCLGKLNPKQRDLGMHRYFESSTVQDFADATGRSVGGLKVTLHRVRNSLLKCIEGHLARSPERK